MRIFKVISHSYELRSILLLTSSLLLLTFLASCRSNKNIVCDKSLNIDSIATSANNRTIASLDSIIRSTSFDFDTLEVRIERHISVADTVANKPEVFQLRAVKGRLVDNRAALNQQLESYNQFDSLAYKQSSTDKSTEHTTTTRIYTPPDGTVIFGLLLLLAALIIYAILHKKLQ